MGKINLLDTEISDKIAAGEVVERPASVVKELVENSIDAGAKHITVEIKNGGSTYIRVTDDGEGMEKDDAAVAFLRHATSKIKTAEDLGAIYTLGFRGEALSSIGAVSEVDLYTKRREDLSGVHTVCRGGEIISAEDEGLADGTTFVIKNLFYNVPARLKFLKKDASEAAYISDIMTRFILSHPEISFRFINSSKQALYSSGDGDLINSVYAVYGKDYAKAMIPVRYKDEYITVSGLCGKGQTARANRSYQSFFVNGRYIKSPMMTKAAEEAYKNRIMIGKFPVVVLDIRLNPALVDINVHPTKLEAKFSNESDIYRAIYNAVKDALDGVFDIPEMKMGKKEKSENAFLPKAPLHTEQIRIEPEKKAEPARWDISPKTSEKQAIDTLFNNISSHTVRSEKPFDHFSSQTQPKEKNAAGEKTDKNENNIKTDIIPPVFEKGGEPSPKKPEEQALPKAEQKAEEKEVPKKPPEEFRIVGQVFDTYIIIETEHEMRLIDQHAAHERLNYEKILSDIAQSKTYSQQLAVGEVVGLSAQEMQIFRDNRELLCSVGFDAEEYGQRSVMIRAVPANSEEDPAGLFLEILSNIADNKREIISEKRQRLLYSIACKAAVKAKKRLSEAEMRELCERVLALDNINTCPHGRPIMISMSEKELEKEFKRIV